MLQLSDPQLELVQVVAGNEIQVLDEAAKHGERLLARTRPASTHARRQLAEQLLEQLHEPGVVTGHGRAVSSGVAGGASPAAPAPRAPTARP